MDTLSGIQFCWGECDAVKSYVHLGKRPSAPFTEQCHFCPELNTQLKIRFQFSALISAHIVGEYSSYTVIRTRQHVFASKAWEDVNAEFFGFAWQPTAQLTEQHRKPYWATYLLLLPRALKQYRWFSGILKQLQNIGSSLGSGIYWLKQNYHIQYSQGYGHRTWPINKLLCHEYYCVSNVESTSAQFPLPCIPPQADYIVFVPVLHGWWHR